MIDERIEHYEKENVRLFNEAKTHRKRVKTLIIRSINENEAVIRELKNIKKLNLLRVSKCTHENAHFENLRCDVCDDCGEITQVDV